MALLLNQGDEVSRSYSYTKPSPTHPIDPEFVGERTGNLFDKSTITAGNFATVSGTTANSSWYCSDFIPITAATYYFQNAVGGSYQNTVVVYDANKQGLRYAKLPGKAKVSGAITFQSGDAYIRINCYYQTDVDTVMVNIGSTALPYEPYGWAEKITSAGQTQAVYLGQVPTTRRVKKLVLDGTESFEKNLADTTDYNYWISIPDIGGTPRVVCTHVNYMAAIPSDDTVGITTRLDRHIMFINFGSAIMNAQLSGNTKNGFKEYLAAQYTADTPVVVWYVLADPETAIVNEPLARIRAYADTLTSEQAGVTIPTTDGNNTISVDTSLSPSRFEIKVHAKPIAKPIHYGFKIDKSVSDPSNAVIYTHDAVTMTPAGMDFTNGVFDYGSWENVWFIKNARPVMLNFDGTEAYDIDPQDYSKKLDGTPSDIADSTKSMNAMIAFPTVWIKRTDDGSYNYIEISDQQIDSDFHAYAHEDANGVVKPYIYLPIYKGSMVDGKLRSISGVKPQSGTTAQQEEKIIPDTIESKSVIKTKLAELKDLLDSGLISAEDYEKKKNQILGI
jgi:hypothetical protein